MFAYLKSERFLRSFTWISALVLIAGIVAFATVKLGGGDPGADARPPAGAPPAENANEPVQQAKPSANDVPKAARVAAGQFIIAAAGREDLKKAWTLSHPDLKAQCGCTYKEWLTGNIPVPYYPVDDLDLASFAVSEATPSYVVLQIALLPKEGSDTKPQTFFIGLKAKAAGKNDKKQWLVDYFAPYTVVPVPAEAQ